MKNQTQLSNDFQNFVNAVAMYEICAKDFRTTLKNGSTMEVLMQYGAMKRALDNAKAFLNVIKTQSEYAIASKVISITSKDFAAYQLPA